jgi:hypothetical protein
MSRMAFSRLGFDAQHLRRYYPAFPGTTVQRESSQFVARGDAWNRWQRRQEDQNADIAQLVEQVIRNDQVVGSNPTIGSPPRPSNPFPDSARAFSAKRLP